MKKTLCLVLALVLVLGLCTVGAGAAFSDAADVQYTTAVDTMAKLGILKGFPEDGSFRPADGVTRAQAAKLIAYMMLGEANAEKMPAKQVFSDVTASSNSAWAMKYINYCYTKNIINGMGDGTFAPAAPVTATQLAKMLLAAVGYGKNGEYVGSGWDVNVFMDAVNEGLFDGSKAEDYDAPATREEASLYVYNTLTKVDQVKFSKDTETYEYLKGSFAEEVWGLEAPFVGVLMANEETVKGDAQKGVSKIGNEDFQVSTTADQIGHLFSVLYKVENGKNVIYACEEIGQVLTGAEADAAKVKGATVPTFRNGVATSTDVAVSKTSTSRFVVNAKNELVACILPDAGSYGKLVVKTADGKTTYKVGEVEVLGAEGLKDGAIVELKTVGDYVTVSAALEPETVRITKKQALTAGGYKYNGDAIKFTAMDVTALSGTVTIDKVTVNVVGTTSPDLTLGASYDLYKDSTGKVWGYALSSSAPAAADFDSFVFVTAVYANQAVDEKSQPIGGMYVQAVNADGEIVYFLSKEGKDTANADLKLKTVYEVFDDTTKEGFSKFAPVTECVATTASYVKTVTTVVEDGAALVLVKGVDKDPMTATEAAAVKVSTVKSLETGFAFTYAFTKEKPANSTAEITTIKTAWVTSAVASDANLADGYVYVSKAQATAAKNPEFSLAEDGKTKVVSVKAYVNGKETALTYAADTVPEYFAEGIHTYSVDEKGEYFLYAADEVKTNETLQKKITAVIGSKLYIGETGYDLSDVKVIDVTSGKTKDFVNSVELLIEKIEKVNVVFVTDGKVIVDNVIYVMDIPADPAE